MLASQRQSQSRALTVLALGALAATLSVPAIAGNRPEHHRGERSASRDGERQFRTGHEQHRKDNYAAAAASWQRAYELGYREATSAYNTACAFARLGDTGHAIDWLETAIADGFEVSDYLETDQDLINLRAEPRFRELRDGYRARLAERGRRGAHAKAIDTLERLEDQRDERGDRWYAVGMDLHHLGEYADAIRAWQRAVELGHSPGASTYNVACAQARDGQTAAALDSLALAVERGYGAADYLDEDDDLDSIRDDRRFAAIRATAETLELPSQIDWHGMNWFFKPGWKTAIERYESHVESNPTSGRGWFNIGFASLQLDDPRTAVAAFEKAQALGYKPAVSAYNVACSHARLNDRDAAFSWLARATEAGFDSYGYFDHDDDLDNLRDDPRFEAYEELADRDCNHCHDWRQHLRDGLRRAFGSDRE